MDNARRGAPSYSSQVWIGQWRLTTLDTDGCMFVLRFLLHAFRSKRPEDQFWSFLERFLFSEDHQNSAVDYECRTHAVKDLLTYAGTLPPEQARALVAYLSECYATESDRSFWSTVSEAIQLYTVAPCDGPARGTA